MFEAAFPGDPQVRTAPLPLARRVFRTRGDPQGLRLPDPLGAVARRFRCSIHGRRGCPDGEADGKGPLGGGVGGVKDPFQVTFTSFD